MTDAAVMLPCYSLNRVFRSAYGSSDNALDMTEPM